ncbi:MAG: DUF3734 domain-containing protein, partial [Rhodomicrobium sp.]
VRSGPHGVKPLLFLGAQFFQTAALRFRQHGERDDNAEHAHDCSIWEVLGRQKDLQYESRAVSQIRRQRQMHQLRHIIAELAEKLPAEMYEDPEIAAMAAYGCTTRKHVVRLLAPPLSDDDHSKDIDFSAHGILARWNAGYADTQRALAKRPWNREFERTEGVIFHRMPRQMLPDDDSHGH